MSDRLARKAILCCRMTMRYQTTRVDDTGFRQRMGVIAPGRVPAGGRRCLAATRVARELDRLMIERGKPKTVVSDNGSEFTSNAILMGRSEPRRLALHRAGKRMQNAFIRSFNGRQRSELERDAVHVDLRPLPLEM